MTLMAIEETDVARAFAQRLRSVRVAKGLSQADLAECLGVHFSAISRYEAGGRKPSLLTLKKPADALSVSIDYLLNRGAHYWGASVIIGGRLGGPKIQQLREALEHMSERDQDVTIGVAKMLQVSEGA